MSARAARNPNFTATEDALVEFIDAWTERLDLPGLTLEHRFADIVCEQDQTRCADAEVQWQYRRGLFTWYVGHLAGFDTEDLERTVVHELSHVVIGAINERLKAGSEDHLEHATECVARALWMTYYGEV